MTTPNQLLGGLDPADFLRDYWQQKPRLIRQALPDFDNPLSGDELAGLALEDDIESRLILEHGHTPWELRRGPFSESDFQQLPARDWTLLVQAVDQFIPEVRELLHLFRFLPSWRLDDIMISFAAPGGSVGPHYDNYDVFLLQVQGHRHWKIGQQCSADSPLLPHDDLRILRDFEQQEEHLLAPGDMLYLPPGVAHYGIAEDDCITWSIGFRAPSYQDILLHFTDYLAQQLHDDQRYHDSGITPSEQPAAIDDASIERLQQILLTHVQNKEALATWFGRFMTEPRYPEMLNAEEIADNELQDAVQTGYGLQRNAGARLAYRLSDTEIKLFASGEHCVLPASLLPLVQLVCNEDYLSAEALLPWLTDTEGWQLLVQLVSKGDLLLEEDDD
ncbi:ribosomal protein uL16 3-hydroxylase [Halopseudomonas salegens]|uniref:50S ribosomal protein L16 3-hydroxylase n=1 Tax=Halopseudomonas salegens TaxID=1434072 RepID=A0A1H2F625_9GAMM|nr:cupin domain-containing protein [Halopseudomonas salegens]SDU02811.1 50S ribosomal protein L16 3-hydroxylase [Halopseudomonas salegens]